MLVVKLYLDLCILYMGERILSWILKGCNRALLRNSEINRKKHSDTFAHHTKASIPADSARVQCFLRSRLSAFVRVCRQQQELQ